MLNPSQPRNPADDFEPEYLLCARYHDGERDDRGYATTAWVPMHVLENIEDPYEQLASKV